MITTLPRRPALRGRARSAEDRRAARLAELTALRDGQRAQAVADVARLAALR